MVALRCDRGSSGSLARRLRRVTGLEHHAALSRSPRTMDHVGWPAGIVTDVEGLTESEIVKRARENQHFFEICVRDGPGT
jgi:hypothetical protein